MSAIRPVTVGLIAAAAIIAAPAAASAATSSANAGAPLTSSDTLMRVSDTPWGP